METLKYEKALHELETIAERLEEGDCDIDKLASQIKRAKELIKACKDKLRSADEEIKAVMADDGD